MLRTYYARAYAGTREESVGVYKKLLFILFLLFTRLHKGLIFRQLCEKQ